MGNHRNLPIDEEERLGLTPKRLTQFDDGTYVHSWETNDLPTYRGKSKYATEIDGIWYYPLIVKDLNTKLNKLIFASKTKAKKQGVPHNITKEYIKSIIPKDKMCPILKVPFDFTKTKGNKIHPHAMSLDRIIPELGYVEGNVMWISHRANMIKGEATAKEVCLVGLFMAENDKIFNDKEKQNDSRS